MTRANGISVYGFGETPEGEAVDAVSLANFRGMHVRLLTLGATIHAVEVPDRDGQFADVTLGHDTAAEYLASPHYFGASIGRVANRLAGGRCRIGNRDVEVSCNDGPNSLHGGLVGFDKRCWTIVGQRGGDCPGVTMRLVSPDGDQGYPGALTVTADFDLDAHNRLHILYRATTDQPTLINLTNHAYWNLGGEGSDRSALDHLLMIPGDGVLPVDSTLIPTGEIMPVSGTPFDFRAARPIADGLNDTRDPQIAIGHGYDHNWVLAPASGQQLAARLVDPKSGRALEVWSDKPGVQFYSGNFLDGRFAGKSGRLYGRGHGVALEPQDFPDTPNRPEFGSIRLDPGEVYHHAITFAFSVDRSD